MTAPFAADPSTALIGGGLIAAVVAGYYAWTRFVLWADTPWAYTEAILNEATEDISFEQVTRWHAETDVRTLPVEEAAFQVLRPRVLAAAEAITREAAS